MEHYKLNFIPSPIDDRDYVLSITSPSSTLLSTLLSTPLTTPSLIDLSPGCTSVKNQGSVGSCTAHAGVALLEYNYRRFTSGTGSGTGSGSSLSNDDIFSERFTYYTTRVNVAGWSAKEDSGAYLRDTLKSLTQYGACRESSFPYMSEGKCKYDETPSQQSYQEALRYQALTYLSIPLGNTLSTKMKTLDTLKEVLRNGYPFMGGFICYSNLYSGVKGNIPLPSTGSTIIGGHAVCFVGYDDSKQVFKFKNSWGSSWGDKGYGYLPYKYLLNGELFDLWTIYTQEDDNKVLGVIKPKTSAEILQSALSEGLVKIGNNQTPTVPTTGITSKNQIALRSFFNRVITMKGQFR